MNLNHLYYFKTLARVEHYTRAAQELSITQPSLSHAISCLEDELGTYLFEKQGRRVVLTKYGKIFLQYVTNSLDMLEVGIKRTKAMTSESSGIIDLGYIFTLGSHFVPDLVSEFLKTQEGKSIDFTFNQGITKNILAGLKDEKYDVVDGQQRIISLVLLKQCVEPEFTCSILEKDFTNKVTQYNIHRNYGFIREWFSLKSDEAKKDFITAFDKTLEVVVICVDKVSEAFQLFDSQNTRGKALDPHDLLKAYHLREMKKYPYEMEHAVTKWEAKDTDQIGELFDLYLFIDV